MPKIYVRPNYANYFSVFGVLFTFAFIVAWALEPSLFGAAESIFPPARWALVLGMLFLGILSNSQGLASAWPALLFAAALVYSFLLDSDKANSLPILLRVLSAIALATFIGSMSLDNRVKVARAGVAACALMVIASEVFGILTPGVAYKLIGSDRLRLYGITVHPGFLGYLAAFSGTYYISLALVRRSVLGLRRTALTLIIGLVLAAATILTDSRTGQIAVVLGPVASLLVISMARRRRLARSSVPWLILAGASLTAVAVPIIMAESTLWIDIVEKSWARDSIYSGSTIGRIEIWQNGLRSFNAHPIFGAGLGSTFRVGHASDDTMDLFYYHSVLVDYLAKGGIVTAFFVIIFLIITPGRVILSAQRYVTNMAALRLGKVDARKGKYIARAHLELSLFSTSACVVTVVFATTEAALQNMYPSFLIYFLALTMNGQKGG